MKKLGFIFVLFMSFCSIKVLAQGDGLYLLKGDSSKVDNTKAGARSMMDSDFIKETAKANMTEIDLAKLAENKSSSSSIKEYAKMIVSDHTKAGKELKKIASKEKVTLESGTPENTKKKVDKLSSLNGSEFDKEFISTMVDDHKSVVKDFENASKMVKSSELKSFITNTLPTLKKHLAKAEKTQKELNKTSIIGKKSNY